MSLESTGILLWIAVFLMSLLSGMAPVMNVELYLLATAAAMPGQLGFGVVLAATLGQMLAKSITYLMGRGLTRIPGRLARRMAAIQQRLPAGEARRAVFVFLSASLSLPPFYVVGFLCGSLQLRFATFFISGFCGRFARTTALIFFPQLLWRVA